MDAGFTCFGERISFAIEARFVPDADASRSPAEESWSYGDLRIYVRERCLTRHTVPGGARDEVRWYLGPIFAWLSAAWAPMLHEQRLPVTVGSHEHPIVRFEQGERQLLDDASSGSSGRRAEMQAWRRRHALWTAAAGGVLPNIWFRRQGDLCEIAYDPGATVGAPKGLEFQFSRGLALVDMEVVAKTLMSFLRWGASAAAAAGRPIPLPDESEASVEEAERWTIGSSLASVLNGQRKSSSRLVHGILYPLSPEVAMFGAVTPNLSDGDACALLTALDASRSAEAEPAALAALVEDMPAPTRDTSWEQGYELALQVLDELGLSDPSPARIDMERILETLGVLVRDLDLQDQTLRGVAIAGDGFRPTVIVNAQARWNKSGPGRRFTLAHEFSHILVDRGRARRVTHSSIAWAPEAVERRANAFAAMFLMPYAAVDAAISHIGPVRDRHDLALAARRLGCGKAAVLEHLMNIDRIDPGVFFRLKSELSAV